MKTINKRVIIYPKDVVRITGKSYRQSLRILQDLKKSLNKPSNQLVNIKEFCDYSGLKIEQVEPFITD
jgi:hypothetical protein